jgi:hypothetical protein
VSRHRRPPEEHGRDAKIKRKAIYERVADRCETATTLNVLIPCPQF